MTDPLPDEQDRRDPRAPAPEQRLGLQLALAMTTYVAELFRLTWKSLTATAKALGELAPVPPQRASRLERAWSPWPGAVEPPSADRAPDREAARAVEEPPAVEKSGPGEPVEEAPAATGDEPAAEEGSGDGSATAEAAADLADLEQATPPEEPPIPRWDELTVGSIRARLSRLEEAQLTALHAWEQSHAARPAVVSMLENRIAKVRSAAAPPRKPRTR